MRGCNRTRLGLAAALKPAMRSWPSTISVGRRTAIFWRLRGRGRTSCGSRTAPRRSTPACPPGARSCSKPAQADRRRRRRRSGGGVAYEHRGSRPFSELCSVKIRISGHCVNDSLVEICANGCLVLLQKLQPLPLDLGVHIHDVLVKDAPIELNRAIVLVERPYLQSVSVELTASHNST